MPGRDPRGVREHRWGCVHDEAVHHGERIKPPWQDSCRNHHFPLRPLVSHPVSPPAVCKPSVCAALFLSSLQTPEHPLVLLALGCPHLSSLLSTHSLPPLRSAPAPGAPQPHHDGQVLLDGSPGSVPLHNTGRDSLGFPFPSSSPAVNPNGTDFTLAVGEGVFSTDAKGFLGALAM